MGPHYQLQLFMWHYSSFGQSQGPVEETVIVQMIKEGQLTPQTLVWQAGQADWLPAGQTSLAPHFQTAAQPLAPQQPANPYAAPQSAIRPTYRHEQAVPLTWMQILFSFTGRIPRRQYWAGALIHFISFIPVMVLAQLSGEDQSVGVAVGLLMLLTFVFMIWSGLAVAVKRWHDRGKSGLWVLIGFVPIIGGFWTFIECGCLRGSEGANQYGFDPT